MTDLVHTALSFQVFLEEQKWKFCFIGGLALQHWGEPRLTRDIDVSLFAGFGSEEVFVKTLLCKYKPRIRGAASFALKNRVLLLKSKDGIGIDIALAGLPFEALIVKRSRKIAMLPKQRIRLCSAEDLVVLKAFADRPQDWTDIEGIVIRQGSKALDWRHVFRQLAPLAELKEDVRMVPRLKALALAGHRQVRS